MKSRIRVNIKGIKCANHKCDHVFERILEDEDDIIYIDNICPKCHSNLLTEKDYENVQTIISFAINFSPFMTQDTLNNGLEVTIFTGNAGEMNFTLEPKIIKLQRRI